MKVKTIKTVIRKKINDWLDTVPTEGGLQALLEKNVIVTGGAIVSHLQQEEPNDYDVYFRTREAALAAAHHYVRLFKESHPGREIEISEINPLDPLNIDGRIRIIVKSDGIAGDTETDEQGENVVLPDEKGEKTPYRPVFLSTNAITLADGIQLVIRFYGEPEEIHKNYDFVHCTSYWSSWTGELVLPSAALSSILTRELVYVGSKYPLCSIMRLRKFIARGWTINAGQVLKILFQLNALDLRDIRVLEDQLAGVDASYFVQLIELLRMRRDGQIAQGIVNPFIEESYLVEVIDQLF